MQGSRELWRPSTLSPDMSLPHLGRAHINNSGTALVSDKGRTVRLADCAPNPKLVYLVRLG
jgi:hypothetical protein